MPNNDEITGNSSDEILASLKDWRENNKDVKGKPNLKFPIQVTKDGETLAIADQENFKELLKDCNFFKGFGKHGKHLIFKLLHGDCIQIAYPITLTLPDNTTLTANSKEELKEGLKAWKESNPSVEGKPSIHYPQNFIKDDETVTIQSNEELLALVKDCFGKKEKCFELVYPIKMVMPDNSTIEGTSKHDLRKNMKEWYKNNPNYMGQKPTIQFPIQIKYKDGSIVDIASKEALMQAKDDCE